MDVPRKKKPTQPPLEPRPTGEKPDARAMAEYVGKHFPKTMARLTE